MAGTAPAAMPRRHLVQVLPLLALGLPFDAARAQAGLPTATGGALAMQAAIDRWTGGARPQPGRVSIEIAELIDNGNAVPVTLRVQSPMTAADHVVALALFAERNPLPEVLSVTLGPRAGRAELATRMRLATSQRLVALARLSDGSLWQAQAQVVVTLAACLEGDGDGG